jgi:hypothetical protein
MAGSFGPGGVGGTSGDAARWGYMAWESLKLKNGTNSTNTTNSRPPVPITLLQTSASNSGPAPRYALLMLTLGATLSDLLLPSWGTLLFILLALLPQANAQGEQVWSPPSALYLLECNKGNIFPQPQNSEARDSVGHSARWCFSMFGTYCDDKGSVRRPKPTGRTECVGRGRGTGYCYCTRVVDEILNPYYEIMKGGDRWSSEWGYMAGESLKEKAPTNATDITNSTNITSPGAPAPLVLLLKNETNATFSGRPSPSSPPVDTLHKSAGSTQTASHRGLYALTSMVSPCCQTPVLLNQTH